MRPLTWWSETHGELAPVGYLLRSRYPENWIRFHSLPESRRYPDSEQEMQEVVRRASAVAAVLFEDGESLYLYKSCHYYEDDGDKPPEQGQIAGVPTDGKWARFRASPGELPVEDDDIFSTWAKGCVWPPDFFEELIRQVAEERESLVCMASPGTGNIFCPYDGGMDIFAPSLEVRKSLDCFSAWRSKLRSGM